MPPKKNELQLAKEALDKAIETEKRNRNLLASIGPAIIDSLRPFFREFNDLLKSNSRDLHDAISEIQVNLPETINVPEPRVTVNVPELKVPHIVVPKPEVKVNVPPIKIPDLKWPDGKMPIEGWVRLMGVDTRNPLPVQLRDSNGKPVNLLENFTQQIIGGGGGGFRHVVLDDIRASGSSVIDQVEGTVKISGSVQISSSAAYLIDGDGNYRGTVPIEAGSTLIVNQVSGSNWSTNVTQLAGTSVAVNSGVAGDGTLRVVHVSDIGLTATAQLHGLDPTGAWEQIRSNTGVATGAIRVVQATDVGVSVSATDLDIRDLANATDSVSAYQVSGAIWSTNVTNTVAVSATDLDIRDLANATDSVSAYQVSGHQWSTSASQAGSWSVSLSGSLTSSVVVGPTPADTADDGNAPVQIGGIARTANPTAVAANDVVKATFDTVGRMVTTPYQIRGLIATAYVSVSTGIETTLLAGSSGVFHDCVMITFANQSSAAVDIDIRDATAGGVVASITIPADSTAGWAPAVPYPQNVAADTWTVDNTGSDVSNTTVNVTALFIKNV